MIWMQVGALVRLKSGIGREMLREVPGSLDLRNSNDIYHHELAIALSVEKTDFENRWVKIYTSAGTIGWIDIKYLWEI